jgi:hypothetical protein
MFSGIATKDTIAVQKLHYVCVSGIILATTDNSDNRQQ